MTKVADWVDCEHCDNGKIGKVDCPFCLGRGQVLVYK